jgi:glutaredoxin-related protein
MKKCKSCGSNSTNKTYDGDTNKYNAEHCESCAMILSMVDVMETVLSQPNIKGSVRNVKLIATITK